MFDPRSTWVKRLIHSNRISQPEISQPQSKSTTLRQQQKRSVLLALCFFLFLTFFQPLYNYAQAATPIKQTIQVEATLTGATSTEATSTEATSTEATSTEATSTGATSTRATQTGATSTKATQTEAMPTETTPTQKQALLLLINRLDLTDIAQMPHLQQLAAAGAVGLMNLNTGGAYTSGNEYATLALGVPAKLDQTALQVTNAGGQGPSEARTAFSPELAPIQRQAANTQSGVYILSMPRLEQSLYQSNFTATFGEAGDILREKGLQTALFGNSDPGRVPFRPAALLTTDSKGKTPFGNTGAQMLAMAPERPYGVRTDYQAMWTSYQQMRRRLSFAVFDLADLYRLSTYRSHMNTTRYQELHQQILQEIDQFVCLFLQQKTPNQLLLIAAPQVSREAAEQQAWLAPVLADGPGIKANTVLTSATTRGSGIVSNLDIMPTVLHFLDCPVPKEMIGYPFTSSTKLAPAKLEALRQSFVTIYNQRGVVLITIGLLVALGLLAAAVRLGFGAGLSINRVRRLLFAPLAMPLCLYVLPLFHANKLWETFGGLIALYLLFVAIPFRILPICQTLNGRFLWLGAWTVCTILIDTWQGGRLVHSSLLSYDPIIGARYYGVGNEYMGVVVGASVLLYGALGQAQRGSNRQFGFFALASSLLLTTFFASPTLGTNTGGALTMAGTAALCFALQKRLPWLQTGLVVGVALFFASSILYAQNLYNSPPSHIGVAAHQVLAGGWQEFVHTMHRKSDMFWRLLTGSVWPILLLVLLIGFAYFLLAKTYERTQWMGRHAYLRAPFGSVALGAWIGLFTNDSGIIVAGMMLLYALLPALLVGLETEREMLADLQKSKAEAA